MKQQKQQQQQQLGLLLVVALIVAGTIAQVPPPPAEPECAGLDFEQCHKNCGCGWCNGMYCTAGNSNGPTNDTCRWWDYDCHVFERIDWTDAIVILAVLVASVLGCLLAALVYWCMYRSHQAELEHKYATGEDMFSDSEYDGSNRSFGELPAPAPSPPRTEQRHPPSAYQNQHISPYRQQQQQQQYDIAAASYTINAAEQQPLLSIPGSAFEGTAAFGRSPSPSPSPTQPRLIGQKVSSASSTEYAGGDGLLLATSAPT